MTECARPDALYEAGLRSPPALFLASEQTIRAQTKRLAHVITIAAWLSLPLVVSSCRCGSADERRPVIADTSSATDAADATDATPDKLMARLPRKPAQTGRLVATKDGFCVVMGDGRVQCRGFDGYRKVPRDGVVQPPPKSTSYGPFVQPVQLSAGGHHTCALGGDGRVHCWGHNIAGQLGTEAADNTGAHPIAGLPLSQRISAGLGHTCALTRDDEVHCWGPRFNYTSTSGAKVGRVTAPPNVVGLASGDDNLSLLHADGRVSAVGFPGVIFADSKYTRGAAFVRDVEGVTQLTAGLGFGCGLTAAGELWFWGFSTVRSPVWTIDATSVGMVNRQAGVDNVTSMSANEGLLCLRTSSKKVWCWGSQRKYGSVGVVEKTLAIEFTDSAEVAVGETHVCVINDAGEVRCTGKVNGGTLYHEEVLAKLPE